MRAHLRARLGRRAVALVWVAWALGCETAESPEPVVDAFVCPDGFELTEAGDCLDIDECALPGACDPRTTCINLEGGFTCGACPPGFDGDGRTGCVLRCPIGQHDGGDATCVPADRCSPGFTLDGADCAPIECEPGQHFDGLDGCAPEGTCADGFAPDTDGDCAPVEPGCPEGEHDDGTGACAPIGTCADGFAPDAAGDCVPEAPGCPEGEHDDGTGACAPVGTCAPGFALDPFGDCAPLSCPADDAGEPDDDRDAARPLAPGEPADGIACPGDPDVFAIAPGPRCRLTARITPPGAVLALLDAAGAEIARGALDGDAVRAEAEVSGPAFARITGDGAIYRLAIALDGHDGGDGSCVDLGACARGWALDGDGDCSTCAMGFHDGGDGACVPDETCSPGYRPAGDGSCVPEGECAPGFRDDGTGACAPIAAGCAPGFHDGGDGACAPVGTCAEGYGLDRLDACRPRADCPAGQRDDGLGRCSGQCAPGFHVGGGEPAVCLPLGDCDPGFVDRGDGVCAASCRAPLVEAPGPICVGAADCADDPAEAGEPLAIDDGAVRGGVLCAGDVDAFRLDAPAGCSARALLWFDPAEGALALEAGPADAAQAADPAPTGARLVLRDLAGPIELRVRGAGPAESARYALRVDVDGHDGGDGACRPLGECAPGYALAADESGDCSACALGFHDGGDGTCVPRGTCADGYVDGDGAGPAETCLPRGTCLRGFADGGDGTCLAAGCSPGFIDRGDGVCVALAPGACLDGYALVGGRACECALGTVDGGDGACVPEGQCSPGFQPERPGGPCAPLGVCAVNHHFTPWGECRPTARCGGGQLDDGIGGCARACAPGFRAGGGGTCVAPPACAPGFHDGGDGACVEPLACSPGYALEPDVGFAGRCLPTLDCPGPGADTFEEAAPIGYGERVDGRLCGADVAIWRVEVPAGCGAAVRVVTARDAELDLELLDAARAPLARAEAADGEARVFIAAGAAGVRYVRVRPYPPSGAGELPYRLRVDRDPLRCPGACAPGSRSDGTGRCVGLDDPCAPGWRDGGNRACVPLDRCSGGYHDGGFGDCVPFDTCAPDAHLSPAKDCVPTVQCAAGARDDGAGRCAADCALGYHDGGDGRCMAPPFCADGHVDDARSGAPDRSGNCTPQGPDAACAPGVALDADGRCFAGSCALPDVGDDLATARALIPGFDGLLSHHGALCPGDPADWYTIDAIPAGCALRARLAFDHDRADLALALTDDLGRVLTVVDDADDDELLGAVDPPARVGLRVTGVGDGPYRLDVSLYCP